MLGPRYERARKHANAANPFQPFVRLSFIPQLLLECATTIWSDDEYITHLRSLASMLRMADSFDLVRADFLVFAHMIAAIAERHSTQSFVVVDAAPSDRNTDIEAVWVRIPTNAAEERLIAQTPGGYLLDHAFTARVRIPYLLGSALWLDFAETRGFPTEEGKSGLSVFIPHKSVVRAGEQPIPPG
ncbi:MAG TPA: hypothetical protein VN397_04110, partial [Candidatus Methylomirabilis sp.]|nr:hypothetical protein [Candidatus Methylomirabilis sp.]